MAKQSGSVSLQPAFTPSLFDGPWQVDHLTVNVRGTTRFETNIVAGAWNSETSEVLVDGTLQPWEQFETFVHEFKHAFDSARQQHTGTPATEASLSYEKAASDCGLFVASLIKHNPKLIEIIRSLP